VHNLIDGMIIGASYVVDFRLGVITTLAVAMHELPQELGDFGVLVYGGFKKSKALLVNFLTALTAMIGGVIGYFLSTYTDNATMFLLPFAAGGFLYISASDLIPEIRKGVQNAKLSKTLANFGIFLVGIIIMYLFTFLL